MSTTPEKLQRLDAWQASLSKKPNTAFVFRHMSKCGGTWLRMVLPAVVMNSCHIVAPDWQAWGLGVQNATIPLVNWRSSVWDVHDRLKIVIDRVTWPLHARKGSTRFVTAAKRNPLAWYWSYYNYLPNQPLSHIVPYEVDAGARTTNMTFEAWTRLLTGYSPGYMSYRFWTAYLAPPECYKVTYRAAHHGSVRGCTTRQALHDLSHFEPANTMDFWIETSQMTESLAEALAAWDESAVDWALLQNISQISSDSPFLGGPSKDPRRPSRCNEVYAALPGLRAQVMRADWFLFQKFNYSMTMC
jgi:hypothetical protein